jgi:hypothetical protein
VVNAKQLLKKEDSGCCVLLRDYKVLLSESCAWQYSFSFFFMYFDMKVMLNLCCLPC